MDPALGLHRSASCRVQASAAKLGPEVIQLETDSLSVVHDRTCSPPWTELNFDNGPSTNQMINRLSVNQIGTSTYLSEMLVQNNRACPGYV